MFSQVLALGMCRSCVKVEGKDSSATLQPFYTLQLDIQVVNYADNYCSTTRALRKLIFPGFFHRQRH